MSSENDEPLMQQGGPSGAFPSSSFLPTLMQHLGLDSKQENASSVASLLADLSQPAWYIRAAAVRHLGELGEQAPLEALLMALHDEHVSVRANAALALGAAGQHAPIERLSEVLLRDNEWQVRESAALALAMAKRQVPAEPLLSALHDVDPQVRQAAMQALAHLHSERMILPGEQAVQHSIFEREQANQVPTIHPRSGSEPSVNIHTSSKEQRMSDTYLTNEIATLPHVQKPHKHREQQQKKYQIWRIAALSMAVAVVIVYLLVWGVLTHTLRPGPTGTQTGASGPLATQSSSPTVQPTHITGPQGKTLFVYPPAGVTTNYTFTNLGWSANGKYILLTDMNVVLLNAADGQVVKTFDNSMTSVWASWSPDSKDIVTSSNTAQIWNVQTGTVISTFTPQAAQAIVTEPHGNPLARLNGGDMIYDSAWSPDGKWIASAVDGVTYGYDVQIWNPATGAYIRTLSIKTGATSSDYIDQVAWSPDGKYLAASSPNNGVYIWNTTTWQRVYLMAGVSELSWSPQGDFLASTTSTGLIKVWQAATGRVVYSFQGQANQQAATALAWSPDGQYIAVSNQDVRIWSVAAHTIVSTYTGFGTHTSFSINSLAWSPDNRELAGMDTGIDTTTPNTGTPVDSVRVWIAI